MKTLITGALKYNKSELKKLEQIGLEIKYIKDETIRANMEFSDIEFIICNSFFLYNDIKLFKNLKYIQVTSAGMDRLPLKYIENKKIKVFNARGVYSIPMAEWTILKILEIYKHSKKFYRNQEKHLWEKDRDILELNNKKATILGYGSVGQEIAKRLKAFGVYINAVDRKEMFDENIDRYYNISQINNILPESDIVILTLPLTEETQYIINSDRLKIMKDKSILVNISRGKIIKENDLLEILETEKFLGVILDVFENEPLDKTNKLWDYNNVIITPHNSFVSNNNEERLYNLIYKNILKIRMEKEQ